jgi:S-disulfanyl-L-cysteine oxidoreductase SoxD
MNPMKLFRPLPMFLAMGLTSVMCLGQASWRTVSARSGVYSTPQAQEGKVIYEAKCGMCHGNALQGMGPNPPLAGDAFLKNWTNRSAEDLFAKTITMMPAAQPGSLTPAQTAQILAYVLSVNRFPAGQTSLPADPVKLNPIVIDNP